MALDKNGSAEFSLGEQWFVSHVSMRCPVHENVCYPPYFEITVDPFPVSLQNSQLHYCKLGKFVCLLGVAIEETCWLR